MFECKQAIFLVLSLLWLFVPLPFLLKCHHLNQKIDTHGETRDLLDGVAAQLARKANGRSGKGRRERHPTCVSAAALLSSSFWSTDECQTDGGIFEWYVRYVCTDMMCTNWFGTLTTDLCTSFKGKHIPCQKARYVFTRICSGV